MITVSRRLSTAFGRRIFITEDFASSSPIRRMMTATANPDRYSILPCPKGCPELAFKPENLKPVKVIRDEPASERLLKASAVTAMEPLTMPARYFPANSRTLREIPTRLHKIPYVRRTDGESVLSFSFTNKFISNVIIGYLAFYIYL